MREKELGPVSAGLVILAFAYGTDGWSAPAAVCAVSAVLFTVYWYGMRMKAEDFLLLCGAGFIELMIIRACGLYRGMPLIGVTALVNVFVALTLVRTEQYALMRWIFGFGMVSVLLALAVPADGAEMVYLLGTVCVVFLPVPFIGALVTAAEVFLKRDTACAKLHTGKQV